MLCHLRILPTITFESVLEVCSWFLSAFSLKSAYEVLCALRMADFRFGEVLDTIFWISPLVVYMRVGGNGNLHH